MIYISGLQGVSRLFKLRKHECLGRVKSSRFGATNCGKHKVSSWVRIKH